MMDERIQDYFGFDLGDGESAIAWVHAGGSAPPMLMEIGGRKNILSVLGEHDELGVLIGEQAYLADPQQLYVRFKSRFLQEPDAVGRLVELFAGQVLRELRRTGKLRDVEEAAFFVGCPSGWKPDARAAYRRCFERAGLKNVEIISESRAAFMFMRESGELRAAEEMLARPTLIVDAGSSTTDYTFVRELRAAEVSDFGENALGGGLIDQLLWKKCLDKHPQKRRLEGILGKCPQYAARCELEARRVKELFFTRQNQGGQGVYALPCESSVKVYYEKPPITCDIACTEEDMRQILHQKADRLGGRSYLEAYRSSLLEAKKALKDSPPELLLLTGGASRMAFMIEQAREVFPEAELLTGAEPEYSIARGLCYALRIDKRTERFEEDVKELIVSDAVENVVLENLPALFAAIAPVIAKELATEVAPAVFRRWKRGEIRTIGEMSEQMRRALGRELEEGALKEALGPVTRGWLEELRPGLEKLTDPICVKSRLPLTTLRLPADAPVDAGRLDIDAGSMVDLGLIQTVVDVVVASVVAVLLGGGGVALMMAGPVGLIISFVIGFVVSRMGTTLAMQHMDRFNMPSFMRALFSERMFRKTMEGRRGELTGSIGAQLDDLLKGPDPSVEEMIGRVSAAIEGQLGDMARRARLLIH